ncbi:hypothetical protein VaNZ11_010775 [Volvox africanus]|uniref:Uncharacterized protein n=1 Tax=Volvox africanus TaxID=51714 RepID=A0ABQ5SA80_9CHLO|nr:hypothetical protein VaNZ11_010775 [Volvox africanus]
MPKAGSSLSSRRRSSRVTNATNILEQQKIDRALKRTAASHGGEPHLEHTVLSDQKCGPLWNIFSRYASRSPLAQQHTDEAGPSITAGGRLFPRRAKTTKLGSGEDGEDSGNEELADALAPAAAAAAAEAAKSWEDDGHHVLDLLQPLLSTGVTVPLHIQEALMHMVLNAEVHIRTSLSERAYRVLTDLLEWHPSAKLEGEVLMVNGTLWTPVGCTWQAEVHRDKARLQTLREGGGLSALVGSALNYLVGAAEAACGIKLPSAPGASERGNVGEIMLLKYWVKMLQVDLDARMGYMRQSGFRKKRTSVLENSLIYRLMQTYANWADGSNSKPLLIRQLAAALICAHLAAQHGNLPAPQTPPPTNLSTARASNLGRGVAGGSYQPQATGGSGETSTAGYVTLISPAEVGTMAKAMLGMMYDVFAGLNRMSFYVRRGAQGRDNDLVRMDLVLSRAIYKDLSYKEPENLQVLLSSLPPSSSMRLLVYMLADAAYRRLEIGGDQLKENLRAVVEHYRDNGVGHPPQVLASDALSYLLERPGNWSWAASAMHFNDLPQKTGLALVVTQLTTAALQTAQREVRMAGQAFRTSGCVLVKSRGALQGGGDDMDVDGQEEDDNGEGQLDISEWEAEAKLVSQLYLQLSERLQNDGIHGVSGGVRCMRLLVGRVQAVGLQSGMPLPM